MLATLSLLFVVLWIGGVTSHFVGSARADQGWLASLFLLVAGLLTLFGARTLASARALILIALFGFIAEAVGVNFSFPFGPYAYTGALQPQLFGVPVVMGLAWMTLVAHSLDLAVRLRLRGLVACLVAALWTTAIDLVIDPLAANRLGYWHWSGGGTYYGIPALNFAGWFATSLLACALFGRRVGASAWARAVGASIVFFFALAALANSLLAAASIGLLLCASQLIVMRLTRVANADEPSAVARETR